MRLESGRCQRLSQSLFFLFAFLDLRIAGASIIISQLLVNCFILKLSREPTRCVLSFAILTYALVARETYLLCIRGTIVWFCEKQK